MDRKIKLLVYFLNLLSKKNQYKDISFDKFKKDANDTGFKNYSNNRALFNFYNENVGSDVKWEDYDLNPYLNDFVSKIRLIGNDEVVPDDVFTDPIDSHFSLGHSTNSDYINFYENEIHIVFRDRESNFLLDLINLSDEELWTYNAARFRQDCYVPDYYNDEIIYMFGNMDDDCREKLSEIATALGKIDLANKIKTNFANENVVKELIKMFDILNKRHIENLFDEYAAAISRASCDSIIDAFKEHFPEGIKLDDNEIIVTYDFFIKFLEENPNIQTFSDLEGRHLINDSSYIEEAKYEYDVDYEELNREYFRILDRIYDDLLDDEETIIRVESIKDFENIMKSLKFEIDTAFGYYRDFKINDKKFKRFKIEPNHIDFENRKVFLDEVISEIGKPGPIIKTYKIPFDEIVDYVMTEKLHETIKNKIRKYLLEN